MIEAIKEILNAFFSYMNQDVMVGIIFVIALGYLVNVFWNRSRKPHACGESCTGCSSINVDEIENKYKRPIL